MEPETPARVRQCAAITRGSEAGSGRTDEPYPEGKAYIGGFSVVAVPSRGGLGVGWQDRRRLPLCAGARVRARLYALIKAIGERRRKAFRVSPFAPIA